MRYFLFVSLVIFAGLLFSTVQHLTRLQNEHEAFEAEFREALARRDRDLHELIDRCRARYDTKPAFGPTPVPELTGR